MEHLLVHCQRARMLQESVLAIFGTRYPSLLSARLLFLGKVLGWEISGKGCGRKLFFVFSGLFGVKGTWWLSKMKFPLLIG